MGCSRHPGRSGRLAGDDGAVIVEFALMLPFLALFMMGLFEFGFGFHRKTQLDSVVGSANRMAAQLGRGRSADAEALRAVSAGISGFREIEVQRVVIWRANASSPIGPRCTTGSSQTNLCNVYDATQVATADPGLFTGTDSCSASAWDRAWCPLVRIDTDAQQDYVGVYVEFRYRALTKISTQWITLSSWNVMRIEPPLGMEP